MTAKITHHGYDGRMTEAESTWPGPKEPVILLGLLFNQQTLSQMFEATEAMQIVQGLRWFLQWPATYEPSGRFCLLATLGLSQRWYVDRNSSSHGQMGHLSRTIITRLLCWGNWTSRTASKLPAKYQLIDTGLVKPLHINRGNWIFEIYHRNFMEILTVLDVINQLELPSEHLGMRPQHLRNAWAVLPLWQWFAWIHRHQSSQQSMPKSDAETWSLMSLMSLEVLWSFERNEISLQHDPHFLDPRMSR